MKKARLIFLAAIVLMAFSAFKGNGHSFPGVLHQSTKYSDTVPKKPDSTRWSYIYTDIYTGDTLDIWYDSTTRITTNTKTGKPVDFYINLATSDTIYGKGKYIVNNLLVKTPNGNYYFDEAKVKMDGNELKVKDKNGDRKLKIDGDEMKVKDGDVRIKADDKKLKVKEGDRKTKIKTKVD